MTGAAKIGAVFALFLFVVTLTYLGTTASAATDSQIEINPSITAGGQDDQPFIATVIAGEGHTVHEFRVYESGDFSDLQCEQKDNWYGPYPGTNQFGNYCQWNAMDGYWILPGGSTTFEFTMDSPDTECCRVMRTEPRDLEQTWTPVFIDICVDKTPPETIKTYGNPHFPDPIIEDQYPHWITTTTPVTLSATDCPGGCDRDNGPHDAGISETWYRNIYNGPGKLDQYCQSYDECMNWQPCTGEECEDWILYNEEPFYKSPESCHIIEFYSVDGVGNEEDIKWQCVFVDDTPPQVTKTVGNPKFEDNESTGEPFTWVTSETDIEFVCTDGEPHPVDHEEICFQVSYDLDPDEYNTDEYCNLYSGLGAYMEKEWCCISATPQDPFVFNFREGEESLHDLEYYCRDFLGNDERNYNLDNPPQEGEITEDGAWIQYYRVDETPPEINKDVGDPQDGICPPGPDDNCYITDETDVLVTVPDPDPTGKGCNIGIDYY